MSNAIEIAEIIKRRVGIRVVARIKERTLEGIDKDGKPFAGYSEKPFAAPAGSIPQKVRARLDKDGKLSFFNKDNKRWVFVQGGYKLLKAVKRPGDGGVVNLTDTGKLLRGLRFLSIGNDGEIRIGWGDPELALLAYYHNVSGAGKGRVVRKFLGLPDDEIELIVREEFAREREAIALNPRLLQELSLGFKNARIVSSD